MSSPISFNTASILSYLSLPPDYTPSPSADPLDFLAIHLRRLPPNLLALFTPLVSPQRRTALPIIRNRRHRYASTIPRELAWPEARKRWPELWQGREREGEKERPGVEQGRKEQQWAERGLGFLGGRRGEVGKLGRLLGEYEEEREAERARVARRERLAERAWARGEEEEEDAGDDGDDGPVIEEQESPDQARITFERVVQEKFIYGLLDSIDYDLVDWDDKWDETDERDREERWFDEEEEADAPEMNIEVET